MVGRAAIDNMTFINTAIPGRAGELLTASQVARMLGVTSNVIYALCRSSILNSSIDTDKANSLLVYESSIRRLGFARGVEYISSRSPDFLKEFGQDSKVVTRAINEDRAKGNLNSIKVGILHFYRKSDYIAWVDEYINSGQFERDKAARILCTKKDAESKQESKQADMEHQRTDENALCNKEEQMVLSISESKDQSVDISQVDEPELPLLERLCVAVETSNKNNEALLNKLDRKLNYIASRFVATNTKTNNIEVKSETNCSIGVPSNGQTNK